MIFGKSSKGTADIIKVHFDREEFTAFLNQFKIILIIRKILIPIVEIETKKKERKKEDINKVSILKMCLLSFIFLTFQN